MLRKLAFLAAAIYLGKKGCDALMTVQTAVADAVPSIKPLNPVISPELADQLKAATAATST